MRDGAGLSNLNLCCRFLAKLRASSPYSSLISQPSSLCSYSIHNISSTSSYFPHTFSLHFYQREGSRVAGSYADETTGVISPESRIPSSEGVQVMLGRILWSVVVVLVVLWLIGLFAHIAGGFVHLLLIVALIMLLYNLFANRRARRASGRRYDSSGLR